MILDFHDNQEIDNIYKSWCGNTYIKSERLLLLKEAIENYKNNRYASCVVLNICQLGGIISDTEDFIKDKNEIKDEVIEIRKMQKEIFKNKNKKITDKRVKEIIEKSEKHRAESLISGIQFGYTAILFSRYIKDVIYANSIKNEDIPNRNKICHGEMVNYNTKKHGLISILCIDALMRLYLYMDIDETDE